jgi:IclR family acetate operon transcriptional repressor
VFVKQTANVVELLEFFAKRQQSATLAEIADALGWPRSSTFNVVNTLVSKGYFYEPATRGAYYPSVRWRQIVNAVAEAEPLPTAVARAAQEVAEASGETACVAAPAGVSALLIYAVESRQRIRFSPWLGERNPIQASASGRALLSQYSDAERHTLYRKITFERYTTKTLTRIDEIEAAVRVGAARGFHISAGEVVEDLVAIAAPLPANGRTLALLLAAPLFRCSDRIEELGALLVDAATRCQATLALERRPHELEECV